MKLSALVREGDRVVAQDASGDWHEATALSGIEPGDKIPIIWLRFKPGQRRMPWPAEYVEWPTEEKP